MSGTDKPEDQIEELIKGNPKIDGQQLREAQRLIEDLRKEGVGRPAYRIASPHERRPLRGTIRGVTRKARPEVT